MIFLDKFFFEKIRLIFDIQNWLWKYDFVTFWHFLKIIPWWYVDSWAKSLLFRTHHLWNSTTELILIYITVVYYYNSRNAVLQNCSAFLMSVERIERKFKAQKPDLFHIFENSWRKFSFINPYKIGLEIAEVILAKWQMA